MDINKIKELREKTSASISDIKKALEEAQGDEQKALEYLNKRSKEIADKKADRETKEGMIFSYIHQSGKLSAMVSLLCETDFVAKTDVFQQLGKDLCMQIVATNPKDSEELLSADFIKDPSKKVSDLITDVIAKTGENVTVGEFVRFEI